MKKNCRNRQKKIAELTSSATNLKIKVLFAKGEKRSYFRPILLKILFLQIKEN